MSFSTLVSPLVGMIVYMIILAIFQVEDISKMRVICYTVGIITGMILKEIDYSSKK